MADAHDTSAAALLRRAAAVYDADDALRAASRQAGRRGFASGAEWMARAIATLRGTPLPPVQSDFQRLGVIKYALATAALLVVAAIALVARMPWLIVIAPLAFYLVEVQMLFLFPAALDGSPQPFRDAIRLTRRAGGAIRAAGTVMILATVMLLGGFAGRGFVRCWCLGCLAVCVWYVDLTTTALAPKLASAPAPPAGTEPA